MDKKPLIVVSICAVILLVMASLTNVVGYQSVKSTTVNESPLFVTRAKRAIEQEDNNILTSTYLGKGLETQLQFPTRDNKTELIQKAIYILNKMTDKELDQLLKNIISYRYQNKIDKIAFDQSIFFLSLLKSNHIDIRGYLININNTMNNDPPTSFCVSIQYGVLACLFAIISNIAWAIGFLIFTFAGRLTLWVNTCQINID